GGLSGQELALIQTVAKTDTAFTVTGLQNNVPYDIQMTSVFPNSESIRSMTGVFRGGVPFLKVLTPRKLVNMGADSLMIVEYRLKNEGTRDLMVELVTEGKITPKQLDEYLPPVILGSNAYYLSRHHWNWHDANARANANGLKLAIIRDADENERVRVAAAGNTVWVGAYKYNPCTFEWVDRTPMTYTNFAPGEPNRCQDERALQFYADGTWNDLGDGGGLPSIAVMYVFKIRHALDRSEITIAPGAEHIVKDTLRASGRVYIGSKIRILSDDPSVNSDSIEVAQIANVPSGLSPVYFDAVSAGSSVHSIVVTGATVDGVNLVAGDEIALYSGNTLVASASFNGTWPMLLNASGFSNGDPITAKLYLSGSKELVELTPDVTDGFDQYLDEGFSVIQAIGTLRVPNTLVLPGNRFNLVSLFVNPPDRNPATHFSNMGTSILHDDEGSTWIPSFSINTIGTWNLERAYYLYRAGTDTVRVTLRGRPIVRANQRVHMHGNRFNQIPMLYEQPEPVVAAFGSISDRIAILQDDEGRAWIPSLSLNTLGDLLPGKGYQLFLTGANLEFTYPEPAPPSKQTPVDRHGLAAFYEESIIKTGLPWTIAITDVPTGLPDETELSLWDGDRIVGAAILQPGSNAVTAWKADPSVDLPGFTPGNRVSARLWNPQTQTEKDIRLIPKDGSDHLSFGTGAYGLATLGELETTGIDSERPLEFALERIYPNPFNPSTTIQYSVASASNVRIVVYNSLGQRIATLVNGVMPVGRHTIVWDATAVASGVYLVRMEAGAYSSVHTVT
ncbi:MAG: T9SS type A sorting domain-containing protein, partial [Synechococcus sp.]|nr:T9SS type A sorting domain-containing protein [Synechococcus sp.]